MSGSNAQTIAADPEVQVNPLAAMNAGVSAAKNIYDLREKQANEAIGNILQQSTDAQGNVDYGTANALAAKAGPRVQMGMQTMLANNANRQAQQFNLNAAVNDRINDAVGAVLQIPDPNQRHDELIRQAGRLIDSGMPRDRVMSTLLNLSNDPTTLNRQLETIRTQTMPSQQKQDWIHGTRPTIETPNATYMPEVPAPGRGPPVTIVTQHGIAPQPAQVPDTRPGAPPGTYTPVIPPDGGGGPPTAVPQIPIQPQPGVPQGRIRPPSGSPLLNPAAPPPTGAPATSTPAPPGASPTPPPPSAAPTAANNQPTYTAPPAGQGDVLGKDIEARTAANLAMQDQQKRLIAGNTALQALELASTGPGTATTSRIYSFLQAQSPGGATPQGAMSDTAWRQVLVKNLLRFAQSSSQRASTDQQLSTQIESNPNPEQLAPAIHHILVQDLGVLKRDIAQTQEMPAASGTGAVVKHVGDFPANTAPEAFMWNEYSGDQRKAIEKEYEDKGQTKKLHDSLEIAVRRGAIPDPRKAPAAPPAIVTPPPAPAPNALVPTN